MELFGRELDLFSWLCGLALGLLLPAVIVLIYGISAALAE